MTDVDTQSIFIQSEEPLLDSRFPTSERGGGTVSSITKNGIIWTFSAPVTAGQYVSGDWWVLDAGGGITVDSVFPAPTYAVETGRNGSLLNPTVGGDSPFDGRVRAGYDALLGAAFPLACVGGDALLSTESLVGGTDWAGASIQSKVRVNKLEVLTVVSSEPPSNAFRPAYVDRTQTLYTTTDVTGVLPAESTASITLPSYPASGLGTVDYYVRGMQRPWCIFVPDFFGNDVHPAQNMKGYHREVAEFLSEAAVMLTTDLSTTALENAAVQLGIDYYHNALADVKFDSSYWRAPILIAGFLLNDSGMLNGYTGATTYIESRDFPDFKYFGDLNSPATSAFITSGETYSGFTVFFTNSTQTNRSYEQLRPDEWTSLTADGDEAWKDDQYRITSDTFPHVGMVLTAQMLGLTTNWDHDATFSMMQRWMVDADPVSDKALLDLHFAGEVDNPYTPVLASKSSLSDFVDDMFAVHWSTVV